MNKTTGTQSSLISAQLSQPPMHIPDVINGGSYKTELVIERSEESTTKILWWHNNDPREEPHNHPWDFTSEILSGGYTEDRYTVTDGGKINKTTHEYRKGDFNHLPANVYHNVCDILPNTVTKMVCGRVRGDGKWGYIDHGGSFTVATTDPVFLDQLREMNPHMKK